MDGGVLAGSLRKQGTGRDKLTVTFQTTIPLGVGVSERREMVGGSGALKGVCLELVKRDQEWFARALLVR